MEGAASANEGAALPGGANGSKEAEEAVANRQQDEGLAAANGDAPLHESANEGKRSSSSANQDAEKREVTNDSKEPPSANENTGCKPSTNEITACKAPASEDRGHKSPANQDTTTLSTNQNATPRPNEHQATPLQDPTNDLTPLAAAANQAQDPWDWSLEEAWLRAPDEEGLAAWGAELEGWEAEPDDDEEELEDWEVELEHCGVETVDRGVELKDPGAELEGSNGQRVGLKCHGAELESSKGQGVGLKGQGAELESSKGHGVGLKGQGVELECSRGHGVGLKGQGAELECSRGHGVGLKGQGVELEYYAVDPNGEGVEPKPQRAGLKGQGVELEHCRVDPNGERVEPAPPEPSHWWSSPDGAWSKLIVRRGRGLSRPGPGSLCRVRLSVRPSPSSPWPPPAAASGCGRWQSVRLGAAEGRWSSLLDAALETMTAGELAWLRPRRAVSAALSVHLGRFTPCPSFWSVPPSVRWRAVSSGHARAVRLLSVGMVSAAGRAFRRSLRAAAAAAGPAPLSAPVTELKAELHAGLAAAQLRLGHPAAAAANAGKALELRPAHLGARYARGVASAAVMDLELARQDLLAVLRARPGHAGAARELARVRDKVKERDTQLATRLGKMFA